MTLTRLPNVGNRARSPASVGCTPSRSTGNRITRPEQASRPRGRARRARRPGRGRGGGGGGRADLDAEAAERLGGGDRVLVGGVVAEHHRAAAGERRLRGEAAQRGALVGGGGLDLDHHLAGLPDETRGRRRQPRAAAEGVALGVGRGAIVQRRHRALELEPTPGRAASARSGASTGSGSGGGRRRARGRPGGSDLEAVAAEPPERRRGPAGEVADVAAAEDRDRAAEPVGRGGRAPPRRRRQEDGVGIGDDLGQRAVEVEEERSSDGPSRRPRGRRGSRRDHGVRRAPARKLRRHQPMSCSRHRADQVLPALAPLLERHGQRAVDGVGGGGDVVRVDEERCLQLVGGAGELGQHQHARILGVWAATNSLATRFMPS